MLGISLSKDFFENEALALFEEQIPRILPKIAIGLVGEGSECFGFDDEISQDHDFGPAFCMWLPESEKAIWEASIEKVISQLPNTYKNFPTRMSKEKRMDRLGLLSIESFYAKYIGSTTAPRTWQEWRLIPENFLATATNGEVFYDPSGRFTHIRNILLSYYPEDVRLKKMSARLAVMAQAGQYNLLRSIKRGDKISAMLALQKFSEAALSFAFLYNKKYMPFYKWAAKALNSLEVLSQESSICLNALADTSWNNISQAIENIEIYADSIRVQLAKDNYSTVQDTWLLAHASQIQSKITQAQLRYLPEMAE